MLTAKSNTIPWEMSLLMKLIQRLVWETDNIKSIMFFKEYQFEEVLM